MKFKNAIVLSMLVLVLFACAEKSKKEIWTLQEEGVVSTCEIEYNNEVVLFLTTENIYDIKTLEFSEEEAKIFIENGKKMFEKEEGYTYTAEIKDNKIYEKISQDMKKIDFKKLSDEIGYNVDYISYEKLSQNKKSSGYEKQ